MRRSKTALPFDQLVRADEHSPIGHYGIFESGLPCQSALMLAALITLPHFSVSSATSLPNSAGVIGMGSPASSARRACNFGSANTPFTARFSFPMIWGLVPLGAAIPYQMLTS